MATEEAKAKAKWRVAFAAIQKALGPLLTPEQRLTLAGLLRAASGAVRANDHHAARGVVLVAACLEHGVRSDDPYVPPELPPIVEELDDKRYGGKPKRHSADELATMKQLRAARGLRK